MRSNGQGFRRRPKNESAVRVPVAYRDGVGRVARTGSLIPENRLDWMESARINTSNVSLPLTFLIPHTPPPFTGLWLQSTTSGRLGLRRQAVAVAVVVAAAGQASALRMSA
jgi:hypothetical protein